MKNIGSMLKEDRIGLGAFIFFLLFVGLIAFLVVFNVAYLQRFETTPSRTAYADEIPLHENMLLRLGGATAIIPDEVLATLPSNISILRDGDGIYFNLASINGLTTYNYLVYRSIVEYTLANLMVDAGFGLIQPAIT